MSTEKNVRHTAVVMADDRPAGLSATWCSMLTMLSAHSHRNVPMPAAHIIVSDMMAMMRWRRSARRRSAMMRCIVVKAKFEGRLVCLSSVIFLMALRRAASLLLLSSIVFIYNKVRLISYSPLSLFIIRYSFFLILCNCVVTVPASILVIYAMSFVGRS